MKAFCVSLTFAVLYDFNLLTLTCLLSPNLIQTDPDAAYLQFHTDLKETFFVSLTFALSFSLIKIDLTYLFQIFIDICFPDYSKLISHFSNRVLSLWKLTEHSVKCFCWFAAVCFNNLSVIYFVCQNSKFTFYTNFHTFLLKSMQTTDREVCK